MRTTEKRYRKARQDAGIRREEACVRLGISIGTLGNWEGDKTNPDANHLRKMAELYDVSADYLLGLV